MNMNVDGSRQDLGVNGEAFAIGVLRGRGFEVIGMGYECPFDLLVNGKRVEVKVSRYSKVENRWHVNIHRHGKVNEKHVDAYLILLDLRSFGKKKPLVLLIPAPAGKKTLAFSLESLLTIHNSHIEAWHVIGEQEKASDRDQKYSRVAERLSA